MAARLLSLLVLATMLGQNACQDYTLSSVPGYLGKEFYAVDLNNYDGSESLGSGDAAQFSLTVSNPINSTGEAWVTITQQGGDGASAREEIVPGELEIFDLPRWDAEDSFLGNRSFFVESDVPVTVHQFNPANNTGVYSNDASLLLPVHSLGDRYRAACWPHDTSGNEEEHWAGYADFITVVATQADTRVRLVPTADVRAGDGVPPLQEGQLLEVYLRASEVLQVESDNSNSADGRTDLTGTLITADKPVAVFSGNECALVPDGVEACDHIEEQLFPTHAWGSEFYVAKYEPRKTEDDLYRIIADEDSTEVTTKPLLDGFPVTLDGGEFHQFVHDGDFELTSSSPVSVIQYMTGSQYCGDDGLAIGDPAMSVVLPLGQFIDEVIFLTPDRYMEDYINIVAPVDIGEIILDGDDLTSGDWTEFPSGTYKRTRIPATPGVHHLAASQPVGVTVYGYDNDVSYAYPGGAFLTPFEEEVPE
jgi:hypothetical protein